jgi:hypothetical protein
MKTNFPHIPWPDPDFQKNQSQFPTEELWKYIGQHVAWSWDGRRILAGDPDLTELRRKLVAAGHDPQRVVFDYVDDPDVSHL